MDFIEFLGTPWNSLELHKILKIFMGLRMGSMAILLAYLHM